MKKTFSTSPTNKDLRDLLPAFLVKISPEKRRGKEEVFKAWFAIIGEEFSGYTKPVFYEKGVLTVRVQTSTLYHLFCTYEKPRLLQEMRKKIPTLRDLKFRFS